MAGRIPAARPAGGEGKHGEELGESVSYLGVASVGRGTAGGSSPVEQ